MSDDRMSNRRCAMFYLPGFFATVAIIFGTAANFFCETVKFTQVSGNGDASLYVSPWNFRTKGSFEVNGDVWVYNTCQYYSSLEDNYGFDFSVDAKTRTVWAFSIMTPILGGLLLLPACLGPCRTVSPSAWKCLGYLLIIAGAFQGLTLMVQSSSICNNNPIMQYFDVVAGDFADTFPDTCEWATGYALNITSVICWILAGVLAITLPSPEIFPAEPPQEQTVTYTQTADGKVAETNLTVVKGTAV
ncbi:hypothetical protein IV203_026037 [Nitzschia inconspicua]|uniref:Uncharacterized protein n=1 Tax=Nitzschia inconspicua TaxID=303405 RepID=A0A9K3K7I6_9STRA|nr:hypothetical protein IV203_009435 [Nitzschia inconspicua]KAG7362677.1 hypothetical protein IV203_026037 [Nitzschia inconspicua]